MVPVLNDEYTLRFCLESLVPYFDEIVVFDDSSTDHSFEVALDFLYRSGNVKVKTHGAIPLGWITARNVMLSMTDSRWLYWIDSDDVLMDGAWDELERLAREAENGGPPVVRLGLTELWGDLHHGTGRYRHFDPCHVFVDRKRTGELKWAGRNAASLGWRASRTEGVICAHLKGVKPDSRLALRKFIRPWLNEGRKCRPESFGPLPSMDREEVHRLALNTLLHSRQDRIQKYKGPALPSCLAGEDRFEMVYDEGKPVDRVDREDG